MREEGKKGLKRPSPEEEAWQNRSCDLPNFTDMVKYLHKRVNTCIILELCRAHTPRAHCAIYRIAFVCMAVNFRKLVEVLLNCM